MSFDRRLSALLAAVACLPGFCVAAAALDHPHAPARIRIAQDESAVPMPQPDSSVPTPGSTDLPSAVPSGSTPEPASPGPRVQSREIVLSLKDLGARGPLALRGSNELYGVQFGIRSDEVVVGATLKLSGAMSPSLIPQFSNVTVTMNEQYVGTIPAKEGQARFDNLEMTVDPVFFAADNRLNFRFSGRYTDQCNDPLSGLLWSTISDASTLSLKLVRLPPQFDLARLPLPFFDAHDRQAASVAFAVGAKPSNEVLRASGIVSSWFGQLAGFRGARFPVSSDIAAGKNIVVVATPDLVPTGFTLPAITGPTVAVLPSPADPSMSVLLVAGRTGDEVVTAAQALAVGSRTLGGAQVAVTAPALVSRKPYDAPAWIPTDRPVRFGELVDADVLQATGYTGAPVRVPFRTAPDLYTWRNRGFPTEVRYRGPPGPIVDLAVSRLDMAINDIYLASMPLADESRGISTWFSSLFRRASLDGVVTADQASSVRTVDVPAYDVFGQNQLQFSFDSRPLNRGNCVAVPADLRMSIDPDSTIDLSRAKRFTSLPNLAFFVNSGFPFSRMADLSETAAIVPDQPDPGEIEAFLDVLGHIGSLTGNPAVNVAVGRPADANRFADRDLLLVGTVGHLQPAASLLGNTPFRIDGRQVRVTVGSSAASLRRWWDFNSSPDQSGPAQATLQAVTPASLAVLVGGESTLSRGRSIVAVLAGSSGALQGIVPAFVDADQAAKIQGDLSIVSDGRPQSYTVGSTYTVGSLPIWYYPGWALQGSPLTVIVLLLLGVLLLARVLFGLLRRRAQSRMRDIET